MLLFDFEILMGRISMLFFSWMWAGQATALLDVLKHVSRNMPPCFRVPVRTLGSFSFRQHDWTHTCEDRVMKSSDLWFSSLVRFEVGFQNVWYGAEQKKKPRNHWILLTFVEWKSHPLQFIFCKDMTWNDQQDQDPGSWRSVFKTFLCYGNLATCDFPCKVVKGNSASRKETKTRRCLVLLGRFYSQDFPSFCSKWEFHSKSSISKLPLKKRPHLTTLSINWISFVDWKQFYFTRNVPFWRSFLRPLISTPLRSDVIVTWGEIFRDDPPVQESGKDTLVLHISYNFE